MGKTLTTYVNEAVKGSDVRLVDMEEIVYPDGKVIKIADVEEKFHTSCMYIFSAYAFFAPAVKALTPIITNEIDTMATDGIRIFMNPRFTAELTDTQCIFVILHECMHNILNHRRLRFGLLCRFNFRLPLCQTGNRSAQNPRYCRQNKCRQQ